MVEHSRGIDHLEPSSLVVGVAYVQGLGGEGVGLNLHIGLADAVDETGLAHVGVPG